MADPTPRVLVTASPVVRRLVGPAGLARLAAADPRARVELVDSPEQFAEQVVDADAALIWPSQFRVPEAALRPGGRLRWIQSIPAGVNELLTPAVVAAEHVQLTSSKGPMGPLMAEHAVALLLALARRLPEFLQGQAERRWRRDLVEGAPLVELTGKTVAILGVGQVGGHLARICRVGFGMRVLGMARQRQDCPHVDRYFDRADLHAALGQADAVVLTMPITPATERIVDAAALAAMRPTAFLVNVARGALVDEAALVEALRAGRIAGAGLDATAVEPLAPTSPLWALPNVVITPHVSAITDRFGEHMVDFWCGNIRRFVAGEPLLGRVDRQAGY